MNPDNKSDNSSGTENQNNVAFSVYYDKKSTQRRGLKEPLKDKITEILPRRTLVWTDDSTVDKCFGCQTGFGYTVRKHHCRGCGRIFCHECSKNVIKAATLNSQGLANQSQYLADIRRKSATFSSYRSCKECHRLFTRTKVLSDLLTKLETSNYSIVDIHEKSKESEILHEACKLYLSKFREIQYSLPGHRYTKFELDALESNVRHIAGHSKLTAHYLKSTNWDTLEEEDVTFRLTKLTLFPEQGQTKPTECWDLMCSRQCKETLEDSEVIDILLNVRNTQVRQYVIPFLTKDPVKLRCYISVLTYASRFDNISNSFNLLPTTSSSQSTVPVPSTKGEFTFLVAKCLIKAAIEFPSILHSLYWELLVQLEDSDYQEYYRDFFRLLNDQVEEKIPHQVMNLKRNKEFIDLFSDLSDKERDQHQDLVTKRLSYYKLDTHPFSLSLNPKHTLTRVDTDNIIVIKSATRPVFVPCKVTPTPPPIFSIHNLEKSKISKNSKGPPPPPSTPRTPPRPENSSPPPLESSPDYSFIFKTEDIRKDQIISSVITMMDLILKENGLDLNIITYNVLPTGQDQGLIEIVPQSETVYNINNKFNYSIQNYISEKNPKETVDSLRSRFIKSTAAYCVITYLLGIGDRHLDNIMVTDQGTLFHIDYSFILGLDPKMMAPQIRITSEMMDALGGQQSKHYRQFEDLCAKCYNILRLHATLFSNMLYLLTKIDSQKVSPKQIQTQVYKRFLPGENRSQARLQFKRVILNSRSKYSWIDFVHHHAKETFNVSDGVWNKLVGTKTSSTSK